MEIPSLCKGYLYPSARVSRCPRFHRCVVSNKCQNYDPHQLDCSICESRSVEMKDTLGGYLPEGEIQPDIQDAITTLEKKVNRPFAHPDAPSQDLGEITAQAEKERKAADVLQRYMSVSKAQWEETVTDMYVNPETKQYTGRFE